MLSSALMAVLIAATPARHTEPAPQVDKLNSVCGPQFDRKFVHFVETSPSEKALPGLRLVAQTSTATPLVASEGSNCVRRLTRLDLGR